jgi:hypothetical protein
LNYSCPGVIFISYLFVKKGKPKDNFYRNRNLLPLWGVRPILYTYRINRLQKYRKIFHPVNGNDLNEVTLTRAAGVAKAAPTALAVPTNYAIFL